eukprot:gene2227-2401_t
MKWTIVFLLLAFIAVISAESKQCKPGYQLKNVNVHYKTSAGVWKDKKDQRCIKIPTKLPKCPEGQEIVTVIKRHKLKKGWKVKSVSKCMKRCKKGFEAKHITVLSRKKGESNWKRKRARRCLPKTPALKCLEGYTPVKRLVRKIFANGKVRVKFTQRCQSKCQRGFIFENVHVRTSKGLSKSARCVPKPKYRCITPARSHRRLIRRKLPNGKYKVRYVERCVCPTGFKVSRFGKTFSCKTLNPKVSYTHGVVHCPTGFKVKYSIKAVSKYINGELVARPRGRFSCVQEGACKDGFVKKAVIVRRSGKATKTSLCVPKHNPCPKGHKHKLHYKSVLIPSGTSFKSKLEFRHKCVNPCKPGFHVHKVKVKVDDKVTKERRCVPNVTLKCVSPAKLVRNMTRRKLKSGKFHVVYHEKCVCPKNRDAYRRKNKVVCKKKKVPVSNFDCPKGQKSRYKLVAVLKTLKSGKQVARPVGELTCVKDSACKVGHKKKTVTIHSKGGIKRTHLCIPALNPCPNGHKHKFSYKAVIQNKDGKVSAVLRPTHKCILKACKPGFKRERVGVRTSKKVSFAFRCVPKPRLICRKPSKKFRRLTRKKLSNGKYKSRYVEKCICPRKYVAHRKGKVVTCKSTKLPHNGEFDCKKGEKVRYVVRAVIRYINGKRVARPLPRLECVPASPCKKGHSKKHVVIRSRRSYHRAHICVPIGKCPKTHFQRIRFKAFIHKSGKAKLRTRRICTRKPCKRGFELKRARVIRKQGARYELRCVPKKRLRCIGGISIRRLIRRKQSNGRVKVKYTEQCKCAKGTKVIRRRNIIECLLRPKRKGKKIICPKGKKLKLVVVARARLIKGKLIAFPKPYMKCVSKTSCKTGFQSKKVTLRINGKVSKGRLCVPRIKACTHGHKHKIHIRSYISKRGRPVLRKFTKCVSICRPGRAYKKVVVRSNKKRYITFRCVRKAQLICRGGRHIRRVHRKKLSNGKYRSRYHESCRCPKGFSAIRHGRYIICKRRKLTLLEKLKIKMVGQVRKAKLLQQQMNALNCSPATKAILQQINDQIAIKQKLIQKLEDK